MNTYDIEIDDCPTTESIRARNAKNALRSAAEVVRKGDWNADNIEFCVVNQINREDLECGEVQIAFYLDWYNGDGVEGESPDRFEGTERQAIAEARRQAQSRWDNVGRVHPADDDVISLGPRGKDGYGTDQYVTVRRERP